MRFLLRLHFLWGELVHGVGKLGNSIDDVQRSAVSPPLLPLVIALRCAQKHAPKSALMDSLCDIRLGVSDANQIG